MPEQASALRCQHVAVEASDMERSLAFYRSYLGMKLSERHAAGEVAAIPVELAFLRFGTSRHHDLVLVHNPRKTYLPRPAGPEQDLAGAPGFHHFAFECPDRARWLQLLEKAGDMGLSVVRGPVLHSPWQQGGDGSWGENESFYVLDPDGHRIEIFCNMASIAEDGSYVTAAGDVLAQARVSEI